MSEIYDLLNETVTAVGVWQQFDGKLSLFYVCGKLTKSQYCDGQFVVSSKSGNADMAESIVTFFLDDIETIHTDNSTGYTSIFLKHGN